MRFIWSMLTLVLIANVAPAQISTQAPGSPRDAGGPDRPGAAGLSRGVNFGNMLEAPFEGAWGLSVEEVFFDKVVEAGMDHIRLPVSWTHHADQSPPYTIDPAFLDRVAWCVDQAQARGLKIIVNTHHYDALNEDPAAETPRALAIWSQVATRFAGEPRTGRGAVYFEVLNEPHGAFNADPELWNTYLAQALGVIRQTNPTRWVMAGPVGYNAISSLPTLELPDDTRTIATVHFYSPFAFTHQGAEWVDPSPPIGTEWTGDAYGLLSPWQNWSWGTTVTPIDGGLSVEYEQGWAGLYLRRESSLEGVTRVRVFADTLPDESRVLNLIVGTDDQEQVVRLEMEIRPRWYEIDLPGGAATVDKVILQNATPEAQSSWQLSRVEVVTQDGSTEALLGSEAQAVEASMRSARRWAKQQHDGAGVPMYLGEFGAYSTADMTSRVLWTRSVRRAAARNGMGWGYWELAAGFGFYDPQAEAFRETLLRALTD